MYFSLSSPSFHLLNKSYRVTKEGAKWWATMMWYICISRKWRNSSSVIPFGRQQYQPPNLFSPLMTYWYVLISLGRYVVLWRVFTCYHDATNNSILTYRQQQQPSAARRRLCMYWFLRSYRQRPKDFSSHRVILIKILHTKAPNCAAQAS